MTLDPESLKVQSFATTSSGTISDCCTGCVSGCGIYPTNGTCESQGETYEYDGCGNGETVVPITVVN